MEPATATRLLHSFLKISEESALGAATCEDFDRDQVVLD